MRTKLAPVLLAASVAAALTTPAPADEKPEPVPTTYCNPISLPNYPLGRRARDVTVGAPVPKDDWLWLVDRQQQFRELADVSVLWHERSEERRVGKECRCRWARCDGERK